MRSWRRSLAQVSGVTKLLDEGRTPEQILEVLLGDIGPGDSGYDSNTVLLQLQQGTCGEGNRQHRT